MGFGTVTLSTTIADAGDIGADILRADNASEVLGLLNAGGMATQNPSAVAITGGTITGVSGQNRVLFPTDGSGAIGNVGTGEDNLKVYTLPANTLSTAGDALVIRSTFTCAANANNKRVRFYVANRLVYDSTAQAVNGGTLVLQIIVSRGSGATDLEWTVIANSSDALWTTRPTYSNGVITSPAGGWAADFVVGATGEATATNDIVNRSMHVQLLKINA